MNINVIEADGGVTHVVLDGRFDIAGAQEADPRFSALAQDSTSWSSTSPAFRSSHRSACAPSW
jgi:hypothetical protein